MDPVKYLPAELALSVFSHLSPSDVFALRAVSKSWNSLLSSSTVLRDVHASQPFASSASTLESRLRRTLRIKNGSPSAVLKVDLRKYCEDGPQTSCAGGTLAVTWSHADGKDNPVLEIYDFGAGRLVVAYKLKDLLSRPEVQGDEVEDVEAEVMRDGKTVLVRILDEDRERVTVVVVGGKTGEVLGRVVVDSRDEEQLDNPENLYVTDGEALFSVWINDDGHNVALVHNVRSGEEVYRETLQGDCEAVEMDSRGGCYALVERVKHDGVYVLHPFEPRKTTRFIPMTEIFGCGENGNNFRLSSIMVQNDVLYAQTVYSPEVPASNQKEVMFYDLLASTSCKYLYNLPQAGAARLPAPIVLRAQRISYQKLYWESNRMGMWGYTIPSYHSVGRFQILDASTRKAVAVEGDAQVDPTLRRAVDVRDIFALGPHNKCTLPSHDDGLWVFRPRNTDSAPCYVMLFDETYKVPEGLGKEMEMAEYVAVVSKGVYRAGNDEEDEEELYREGGEVDNRHY